MPLLPTAAGPDLGTPININTKKEKIIRELTFDIQESEWSS